MHLLHEIGEKTATRPQICTHDSAGAVFAGVFFRLYILRAKTLKWRQLRAHGHCRKHHHLPLHSILCGSGPKKNKYCVRAEHIWLCIPILQCAQLTTITSCAASVFSCSHRKSYKGLTIMGKKLRYVLYFLPFGLVHPRYSYSWPT